MILRRTRLAAAALAVVSLGSWPAGAGAADGDPARAAPDGGAVEQAVAAAERAPLAPEEPRAERAQRRYEEGARRHGLGDFAHAALALAAAVDEPEWAGAPDRPRATFLLADALRRDGLCGAARVRYQDLLAAPEGPASGGAVSRADVVSGALDCAVKERRRADVERLLAEATRLFGDAPPPEVRYLAAKAASQRTDLPRGERVERALEAFAQVHGAFQLQAWYFQGALEIEDENPRASLEYFESCARAAAETARDREVRELCLLAAGRVHAELGDVVAAIEWYGHVPADSPHFGEAVYEMALAHVRAKQWDAALRMTSIVPELVPEAPQAPEATLLRGHLLLRLRRYAEAMRAYDEVIDAYAPVRDELDAILATRDDPVRWFDELIGPQGGAPDVVSLLPPVAVRWATASPEVAAAVELVRGLDGSRRELQDGRDLADRLDALLRRGGGVDAFPDLRAAYARAQAAENAAARAVGEAVTLLSAAMERTLPVHRAGPLLVAQEARAAVEQRFAALPRSAADVDARVGRLHGRIDAASRAAHRLGVHIDGGRATVAALEAWLDRHRDDATGEVDARHELGVELRRQRRVLDEYGVELAALRQALAMTRDAAGGTEAMQQDERLRAEYVAALEEERLEAQRAPGVMSPGGRALLVRVRDAQRSLADARARARAVEARVLAEAARRASALQARIDAEREELAAHRAALDAVQAEAREVLGGIAVRSVADVRTAFYRLVLKADLGLVDVAWSRKRHRLERIQALAVQKDAELEQLDREYRGLLREVE